MEHRGQLQRLLNLYYYLHYKYVTSLKACFILLEFLPKKLKNFLLVNFSSVIIFVSKNIFITLGERLLKEQN
jgi:hypothetical protein